MTPTEYRCASCGGPPRDEDRFQCADCGRPLGICADCGWCVRFFASDNPVDCDGCGFAPLSHEEEEGNRSFREHMIAALRRQMEALKQMQERSGPIYELARERSRIISEAYRSAGRPRKVSLTRTPEGWEYVFHFRRGSEWHREPATKEDADAWYAWWRERDRLRRALGSHRGQGTGPPGKAPVAEPRPTATPDQWGDGGSRV